MSRTLAQFLSMPEQTVAKTIASFEDRCGYPSHDVRLLAEINSTLRVKTKQLGLDPDDTTAKELYHSLLNRLEKDSSHLSRSSGISPDSSWADQAKRIVELAKHSGQPTNVWVLKRAPARDILRARPPRKLMKFFHCRSMDSLLKRHSVAELYSLLPKLESQTYIKNLSRSYCKLTPNNFEQRPIEFAVMDQLINGFKSVPRRCVSSVPHLGVVAIWPPSGHLRQIPAIQSLLVMEAAWQMHLGNSLLKLSQGLPTFGKEVAKMLNEEHHLSVGDYLIPWDCLHHHSSHQASAQQQFEPYLNIEDFHWRNPAKALAGLHPTFRWWADSSHVAAARARQPVSLNLLDVIDNYLATPAFSNRFFQRFQQDLWSELLGRYFTHPAMQSNLDNWLGGSQTTEFATVPVEAETNNRSLVGSI